MVLALVAFNFVALQYLPKGTDFTLIDNYIFAVNILILIFTTGCAAMKGFSDEGASIANFWFAIGVTTFWVLANIFTITSILVAFRMNLKETKEFRDRGMKIKYS
jgi:hypothetical protein